MNPVTSSCSHVFNPHQSSRTARTLFSLLDFNSTRASGVCEQDSQRCLSWASLAQTIQIFLAALPGIAESVQLGFECLGHATPARSQHIFGAFGGDFSGSLGIPHWVPCRSRGLPPDHIRLPSCAVCENVRALTDVSERLLWAGASTFEVAWSAMVQR